MCNRLEILPFIGTVAACIEVVIAANRRHTQCGRLASLFVFNVRFLIFLIFLVFYPHLL